MEKQEFPNLGHTIKVCRVSRNCKQKDLAKQIGISTNYLSLVEGGKKTPSLKVLAKIACGLDMKVADFFPEDPCAQDIISLLKKHGIEDVKRIVQTLEKIKQSQ